MRRKSTQIASKVITLLLANQFLQLGGSCVLKGTSPGPSSNPRKRGHTWQRWAAATIYQNRQTALLAIPSQLFREGQLPLSPGHTW